MNELAVTCHNDTSLLSSLKSSGLQGIKSGQTEIYRAESVSCLKDLTREIWKCGFMNTGKSYVVPVKESKALADVLFELPVAQGDSGAATSFIECRMFDGDPENAQCDVAISLDYPRP